MTPEIVIAVLAIAKIGAVFGPSLAVTAPVQSQRA